MKLIVNGHTLRVITPERARNRDLIRLQEQSGLKLADLRTVHERSDLHATLLLSWLTQANAGMEPDYDEMMDGGSAAIGEIVLEPGDQPAQEDPAQDPQEAASGTPDAAEATATPIPPIDSTTPSPS